MKLKNWYQKNNKLSLREKAMIWWKKLATQGLEQRRVFLKYYNPFERNQFSLTGREIEEMFKKETSHIDSTDIEAAYNMQIKSNQEENPIAAIPDEQINTDFDGIEEEHSPHPKFNVDWFVEYVSNLSDEDKLRAFELMFNIIPDKNKWDGINNASPFYLHICRAFNSGKKAMIQVINLKKGDAESSDSYYKRAYNKKS